MTSVDVVSAGAAGGYAYGSNADYAQARLVGTGATAGGAQVYVGQNPGASFGVYQTFLTFDTAFLGTDVVNEAILECAYGAGSSVAFTMEARIRDWGASLAGEDFVSGDDLSGLTLVAHVAAPSGSSSYAAFDDDALAANINKTGPTRLVISSSRQRLATQPSVNEYVSMLFIGATPPRLTIRHSSRDGSGIATSVIYPLLTNGTVNGSNAVYSTARDVGATVSINGTVGSLGQHVSGSYTVYQHLWEFDTAFLGTDVVTSAVLALTKTGDNASVALDVEARLWPWTPPLEAVDFSPGSGLAALPLLAHVSESDMVLNTRTDLITDALIANLNAAGKTRIVGASSRQRVGDVPSGSEFITVALARNATEAYRPTLTLIHGPSGGIGIADVPAMVGEGTGAETFYGTGSATTARIRGEGSATVLPLVLSMLSSDTDASSSLIYVEDESIIVSGKTIQVDSEIMWVRFTRPGRVGVDRGYNGTIRAAHALGASVYGTVDDIPPAIDPGDILVSVNGAPVWMAPSVSFKDLGVIAMADLMDGIADIYEVADNELVIQVLFREVTFPDEQRFALFNDDIRVPSPAESDPSIVWSATSWLFIDDTENQDSYGKMGGGGDRPPEYTGTIKAAMCITGYEHQIVGPWLASHDYTCSLVSPGGGSPFEYNGDIINEGQEGFWLATSGEATHEVFSSGTGHPDFSGAGPVVEGDITWVKYTMTPTAVGSVHIYALVANL